MATAESTNLNSSNSAGTAESPIDWYQKLLSSEPSHLSYLEKVLSIDRRVTLHTTRQLTISSNSDVAKVCHLIQILNCEYLKEARDNVLINILDEYHSNLGFGDISLLAADAFIHTAQFTLFTDTGKLHELNCKYFEEIRPSIQAVVRDFFNLDDRVEKSPF